MENFRRSKDHHMSRSKTNVRCKKHPKHRQSPGVCSVCLGEKLSQLSNSSRSTNTMASSCSSSSSLSSLSSHYSSSPSSYSSPMHRHRIASEARGSISFLISGKNYMLTKSRSMAFVPRRMRTGEATDAKKKGGFWSKLLGSSGKSRRTDEVLMHSRTMRERVTNMVH